MIYKNWILWLLNGTRGDIATNYILSWNNNRYIQRALTIEIMQRNILYNSQTTNITKDEISCFLLEYLIYPKHLLNYIVTAINVEGLRH